MKKLLYSASFLALCLGATTYFSSCKPTSESTTGDLNIVIKGQHDGETVVLFETQHTTPDNNSINYQVLNFMLSDMNLIKDDGSRVALTDIYYIDFKDNHSLSSTAANGEIIPFEDIEIGNYTGLEMGFGVNSTNNAMTFADFPTSSPLGDASNYWSAWDSYIFSRVEGRFFENGNPMTFFYHSGIDDAYFVQSFEKDIVINADETTDVVFILNLNEIFYPESGTNIYIPDLPTSHAGEVGSDEYNVAKNTLVNIANALEFAP